MRSSARSTRPAKTRTTRWAASRVSHTTGPPTGITSPIWCGICATTTNTCAPGRAGASTAARSPSTLSRPALFAVFEGGREAIQQRTLTLQQFDIGLSHGKPADAVDFGEFAEVAG